MPLFGERAFALEGASARGFRDTGVLGFDGGELRCAAAFFGLKPLIFDTLVLERGE